MKINFEKLKNIISEPDSKNNKANHSEEGWREFMVMISNYIFSAGKLNEDELAMHTMSMQNWLIRKDYTTCNNQLKIGDIYFADLGVNYKPEFSYPHPVLILEFIGQMILIVPVTTSKITVEKAFHPEGNQAGERFYRFVNSENGFSEDSALILSEVRTISKGRLLDYKGRIRNLDMIREIKNKIIEFYLPMNHKELIKLQNDLKLLSIENEDLKMQLEEMKNTVKGLQGVKEQKNG